MRTLTIRMGCIMVLALMATPCLWASPLKDPKRMVNEQTVDLSPLFQWWTKHNGSRPLVAWVHVTGSVVGTNACGWIVEAQVEHTARPAEVVPAKESSSGAHHKVVLKNPPLPELAEFENLTAQLKALNEQRTQLSTKETQVENQVQTLNKEQSDYHRNRVRSRVLAQESRRAKQTESQLKNQLKPLDQQIQDIKTKLAAYPNPNHYVLDCLALDTGQTYGGMIIFDHGLAVK